MKRMLVALGGKGQAGDSAALTSLAREIQIVRSDATRRDSAGRMMAAAMPFEEVTFRRSIRIALLASAVLVALVIAYICSRNVDEIAVADGQITPAGAMQIIQHLEGGIVANILVSEGQKVAAGEVLVQLDNKQEMAALTEITARYVSLLLRHERLTAIVKQREPNFDEVGAGYPQLIDDQRRTLEAQRDQQRSAIAVLTAQIGQRSQEVSQLQQQLATAHEAVSIVTEQSSVLGHAVEAGVASRQAYLQTSRTLSTVRGEVARLTTQIGINRALLSEAQERRDNVGHSQVQDAQNELASIGNELEQVKGLVDKELDRIDRLDIRAPVGGLVQDLRVHSHGEVVPAGGQVSRVVPITEDLDASIRIYPSDIGYVRVGQKVHVKVSTFETRRYGSVDATLSQISAITFSDERGQPYYKATIKLAHNMIGRGEYLSQLLPGMTIQADIVTGSRGMVQYLLQPNVGLDRPPGPNPAGTAAETIGQNH
jgi:adhesin transport system membrane fusion protein